MADEAREVIDERRQPRGRERPADTPTAARGSAERHSSIVAALSANRIMIGSWFFALVVVGVVASIALGSWWALAAALVVHVVGTLVVVGTAMRLTDESEHLAPETSARLEEEGVSDPDELFNELVRESESGQRRAADEAPPRGERGATSPANRPVGQRARR